MKRNLLLCCLAAVLASGCQEVPPVQFAAAAESVSPVPSAPVPAGLSVVLSAYERERTSETALAVWNAFGETAKRIARLRELVAHTAGGVRAEAELERIELERLYDGELARFVAMNIRALSAQLPAEAAMVRDTIVRTAPNAPLPEIAPLAGSGMDAGLSDVMD